MRLFLGTLVGKYRLVLNCLSEADMKNVEKNKMADQKRTSGVYGPWWPHAVPTN